LLFKNSLPVPLLQHSPVLLSEVLEQLPLETGNTVIDATLGLGGHTKKMAEKIGPTGTLIAFEWDERNRALAQKHLSGLTNVTIIPTGFSCLLKECQKRNIMGVDAILFDFGISSAHLDDAKRGFSYRLSGPLDMRMNTEKPKTAADFISSSSETELADIFFHLGEERRSRQIAKKIVELRKEKPITTTNELFSIIETVCPKNPKKTASRVFQALRIAVNQELEEIASAIPQSFEILNPGGRIAVISFHSLEDRLIKTLFREKEKKEKIGKQKVWQRVNKKVIIPQQKEMEENPRSRSAKLRIIEKISQS
jgi:16S rRNA (cytosine1402-N4)-methyltransferase